MPKPSDIHNVSKVKIGRRRLMRKLAAAGFGAVSVSAITAEDVKAAASDEVPIVVGWTRETPGDVSTEIVPVKRMVPADWYNNLKSAEEARKRAHLENIPGVVEVSVKPPKFGGRDSKISVVITRDAERVEGISVEAAKQNVPEAVDGVPVELEVKAGTPQAAIYNDGDFGYNPPSGVKVEEEGDPYSYGTLSAPVFDKDTGTGYFQTVQHLWYGENPAGQSFYQPETTDDLRVGKVVDSDCRWDFAIIGNDGFNPHSPNREVVDQGVRITGQYSKDGVAALVANDETAQKQGVRTGHSQGRLTDHDSWMAYVEGGCDDRYHQVKCTANFDKGDSGSPFYHQWSGSDAWAIGINGAGYDPLDSYKMFGTGAYHLINHFNYTFA